MFLSQPSKEDFQTVYEDLKQHDPSHGWDICRRLEPNVKASTVWKTLMWLNKFDIIRLLEPESPNSRVRKYTIVEDGGPDVPAPQVLPNLGQFYAEVQEIHETPELAHQQNPRLLEDSTIDT